jgi:spermidine dehydrogenase
VIRNWQSFQKLGVHEIYAATQPYSRIKLDYPVSMGGYDHPKDPTQPIGLHMVYVPTSPNSGMNARDQARAGRGRLYGQSFEQLEAQLRDQLQRMLGPGGFNHETDILAITVNRWSHGYAYFSNSLYDDADESEKLMNLARQPVGRVSIANSDAAWSAYAHAAIDEAYRAVGEVD